MLNLYLTAIEWANAQHAFAGDLQTIELRKLHHHIASDEAAHELCIEAVRTLTAA